MPSCFGISKKKTLSADKGRVMYRCTYCGNKIKNGESCAQCGYKPQDLSGYVYRNQQKHSGRVNGAVCIFLLEAAAVFAVFIVLSRFDFGRSQELWKRFGIANIYIYEFALFCIIQAVQTVFLELLFKFSNSRKFKWICGRVILIGSVLMITVFFISELIAVGSLIVLVGWLFLGDALCLAGYAFLLTALQIIIAVTACLKCGLKNNKYDTEVRIE